MNKKFIFSLIIKLVVLAAGIALYGCTAIKFSSEVNYIPMALPKLKNTDIALVLGGGGAKGLAHVGVIEELENAGVRPSVIIGTSAGSLVGAMYADSLNIKKIKQKLLKTKKNSFLQYSIRGFPFSLYSSFTFKKYLTNNLKSKKFDDLKIPFISVATDLSTGQIAPFSHGELVPALMASSAYPGAFYPTKINGNYFIDGGVSNPVPVSIAKKIGAKFIIAVDIGELLTNNKPQQVLGLAKRSMEISYIHLSKLSANKADVVIKIPFRDIGTFNDSINDYIYQAGLKAAKKQLPLIIRKLKQRNLL